MSNTYTYKNKGHLDSNAATLCKYTLKPIDKFRGIPMLIIPVKINAFKISPQNLYSINKPCTWMKKTVEKIENYAIKRDNITTPRTPFCFSIQLLELFDIWKPFSSKAGLIFFLHICTKSFIWGQLNLNCVYFGLKLKTFKPVNFSTFLTIYLSRGQWIRKYLNAFIHKYI